MLSYTTLFARPVFALAAASATVLLATPVLAAPAASAPSVMVHLDAADLNAGTTIHQRLATAARSVCTAEGATLREQMNARQCYAQAIRAAEGQLIAQREQAKGRQQTLATAR